MTLSRPRLMRAIRIGVNTLMYSLILYLTCFPLLRGLWNHGVAGSAFLLVFLGHQALNWRWYASLRKGRWNYLRALYTAAAIALLVNTAILIASSAVMAGEIFAFMPFAMTTWARDLHALSTTWTFVLVSFHLGLHLDRFLNYLKRSLKWGYRAIFLPLMSLWGISAFALSSMWSDMLLIEELRTYPETISLFLLQYLGITVFFCLLARACVEPAQHYYRRQARTPSPIPGGHPAEVRSGSA